MTSNMETHRQHNAMLRSAIGGEGLTRISYEGGVGYCRHSSLMPSAEFCKGRFCERAAFANVPVSASGMHHIMWSWLAERQAKTSFVCFLSS